MIETAIFFIAVVVILALWPFVVAYWAFVAALALLVLGFLWIDAHGQLIRHALVALSIPMAIYTLWPWIEKFLSFIIGEPIREKK